MKLKKTVTALTVGLACLGTQQGALGDDIDVFVGGGTTSSKPNLLIVLDNSSNWSASLATDPPGGPANSKKSKFYHEMKALGIILDELGKCQKKADGITCKSPQVSIGEGLRLGVMMFSETGTNGGYVRYALREMNATNRNALKCLLTGNPITDTGFTCIPEQSPGLKESGSDTDNSASNQPYAKVMFEAFKYYGGYTSPTYAHKDQQPPGAINDATNFGPIAYAGWGAATGSAKNLGPIRRDYIDNNEAERTTSKAFSASGGTYNGGAFDNIGDYGYNDPISDGCAKNFVIFISNGNPGTGGDSGGTSEVTLLSNVGGNTNTIKDSAGSTVNASYGDEFARFLYQTDVSSLPGQQNVVTYAMAVYDPADATQTSTKEQIKLMNSMATAGGGNYYEGTDGDKVVDGLLSAINQILARDSTFVTASLPVNTNAQGEFLNQVFIGMFRPGTNGNPRWWGNVKQYRLTCMNGLSEDLTCGTGSSVKLVDSSTPPKVIYSAGTAFIDSEVTSYWTSTAGEFWKNDPRGTSTTAPTFDAPDGEVVEKGGAAQRLRIKYSTDQSTRKILTCASTGTAASGVTSNCGSAGSALIDFNATGASPPLSAASDASKFFQAATSVPGEIDLGSKTTWDTLSATNQTTEFNRLVDWVRGSDNINPSDEKGPGGGVSVRPSIHGDIVHSRPVALDFGGTTGVVVFYGDNHGHLHAVKGNADTASPNNGGEELWSFIAPEFFPKLARLRANQPALLTPVTPSGISAQRKDYFWDGTITAYRNKATNKYYLYITARRGGRFIYALDVSTPDAPKFLWKIDPTTTGFAKLGQTWSAPVVTRIKGNANPVLIFGGGYPGDYQNGTTAICEDAEGTSRDHTTAASGCDRGYGVYIVDAFDGHLIQHIAGPGINTATGTTTTTVTMDYAIPSDVYPMDSDFDSFTDRLYVGDLGGRLWRIEISDTVANKANWAAYLIAEVGTEKKIFYRPGVVQQNSYTGVLVGTGDREKPLDTANLDGFYMVKDKSTGFLAATTSRTWNSVTASDLCTQQYDAVAKTWACDSTDPDGWKYVFAAGEKVVNSPRVAFSVVNFATNVPQANTPGQCLNTGEARSYQTNFNDGSSAFSSGALYTTVGTGGLSATTFVGIVDINGNKKIVIIGGGIGDGAGGGGGGGGGGGPPAPPCVSSTTSACSPTLTINAQRSKRYWYKKKD